MGVVNGKMHLGSFYNGNFEMGTRDGWSVGTSEIFSGDSNDDIEGSDKCLKTSSRWSSSGWNNMTSVSSDAYIPVDPSKTYTLSYRVKGYRTSSGGRQPQHYLGFTTYDSSKRFIDLRNCGGVGNTTLSRALNPGDAYAYISSNSGWYTGSNVTGNRYYFRNVMLYPPTHPEFSGAHRYTRIGYQESGLYFRACEPTGSGSEHRLTLCNSGDSPINFSYSAHACPAGTPVHRGVAGGTFNYTFSRKTYSVGNPWSTQLATFTGESRNSGQPFRFNTAFIRAMILHNYAHPNDGGSYPYSETLWDRMLFIENESGTKYDFNLSGQ